ncbi:fluoride efflux transporter FluC [Natronogracilivirga saccharolytica]|uniref:Fluoride-specific ion channel FluC n=1 Tax=Natronogracilivirga saccharolytica TaxID=2812953 RepID=A0A8J7RVF4_9BACT|nr:CrcB family protein [Natronogracilivirga saccharolytica]MBP3193677.1 CrcB family protein [Natronogracilivirga saccharolytica]
MSSTGGKKHHAFQNFLIWPAVALGGAAGALLRFSWVTLFPYTNSDFPWAIFSENILGAFLLGWFLAIFTGKTGNQRYIRAFFGTGLIGSFTTFSGITIDLAAFVQQGILLMPVVYITLSVLAGLLAAFAGIFAGKRTKTILKVK